MLQLKFDSNLQFQIDAINSIADLFEGQPAEDSLLREAFVKDTGELSEFAYTKNNLLLTQDAILSNLQAIQERNDLEISKMLDGMNFSVEMETGTGKTYVYLRTIFELNKRYGLKKYVIVVPSIAIKEGVLKSIRIMKKHFQDLFGKEQFDYYVYDPKNINNIYNFARNNTVQILIMNIDAFRKTVENVADESRANIIHRPRDQMQGRRPIEFIQAVQPIVIVDEPQSVDNTPKAKEALKTLNPLVKLRYSATHRQVYNLTYSLDAIAAYDRRLVKKIQVSSVLGDIVGNEAFVRLEKVDNKNGFKAVLSLHVFRQGVVKEKRITVKPGADLYELSSNHEPYRNGYIVRTIDCTPGEEYVDFECGVRVSLADAPPGAGEDVQKAQIRETVMQHLQAEMKLHRQGIKVLTLFFIDKVANYRSYDDENNPVKGKYAVWFEEAFVELLNEPRYADLKHGAYADLLKYDVDKVHNGYFAEDKKGKWKDTSGTTAADDSVYDKIMKNKEQLLSMEEPLRFIFSHSALREGWDNPNVFQICTLNETKSIIKKRQEIGRGLRLPVNQSGERVMDEKINRLTVVANESYHQFCKTLQSEYEAEGIVFGRVLPVAFKKLRTITAEGERPIGSAASEELFSHLVEKGYLDAHGTITSNFRPDLPEFELALDDKHAELKYQVADVLKSHLITSRIDNASKKRTLTLNKEVYLSDDFKELWNRISQKTTYSVEYDTEELIKGVVTRFRQLPRIFPPKIHIVGAEVSIKKGGIEGELRRAREEEHRTYSYVPDVLSILDKELEHKITRRAIAAIIKRSGRIEELKINPHEFIRQLLQAMRSELNRLIVHGIKYERIEGEYYEMRRFEKDELREYLEDRAIGCQKNVFTVVEYDSDVEKSFAQVLNKREDIRLFVKLPAWFKVVTPLGTYNPDWAIVKENDEKLYLVRETKGTLDYTKLRSSEEQKIYCGKKHFDSLLTGVNFEVVTSANQV